MQDKKHQFFTFIIILLSIGFLNYFRRIANGYNLSKAGKVLYLSTMIIFIVSIMFVLYLSNVSNIVSFLIGLGVTILSEHIAKLFIIIGDNFNPIVVKVIKFIFKIDLSKELLSDNKFTNNTMDKTNNNKHKKKTTKK